MRNYLVDNAQVRKHCSWAKLHPSFKVSSSFTFMKCPQFLLSFLFAETFPLPGWGPHPHPLLCSFLVAFIASTRVDLCLVHLSSHRLAWKLSPQQKGTQIFVICMSGEYPTSVSSLILQFLGIWQPESSHFRGKWIFKPLAGIPGIELQERLPLPA